jgi:hypothetical protein
MAPRHLQPRVSAPTRKSRAGRFLRFVAVLGVLTLGPCWALAHAARAAASQVALAAGEILSHIDPPEAVVHQLRLNGEVLHVFAETVPIPMAGVLAQAEAACRAGDLELAAGASGAGGLADAVTATPPSEMKESWPLLRRQTPREGMVACLVPTEPAAATSSIARLREYGKTGDLAALGRLQYVYARRLGTKRTQRLLVYNPGRFRIRRLVPRGDGDAVGEDLKEAPRPQGAVRLLTATIEGAAHEMAVYRVTGHPEPSLERMSERLASEGWHAVPLSASVRERARFYERRGLDLLVLAAPATSGAAVTLVLSQSH